MIDTYAWIECFRSSPLGEKAKEYIEGEGSATPTVVVAEVSRKLQREILAGNETKEGRLRRLDFIHASSQILQLPFELAVVSGELDVEMKRRVKGGS